MIKLNINGNTVTILKKDLEWLQSEYKNPIRIVARKKHKYALIKDSMVARLLLGMDDTEIKYVQFLDNNSLNLVRSNLKAVSVAELRQSRSKSTTKKYSSKFKGVSWHSVGRKWQATIKPSKDHKNINLGLFEIEADAAKEYNIAAKEYHGKNAILNQV